MTRYYCDKCGKEVYNLYLDAKKYTINWGKYYNTETQILLCKKCAKEFHNNYAIPYKWWEE